MSVNHVPKWIVASALASALVGLPRPAAADGPSKDECIAANESADSLRRAGKLQAARKRFEQCLPASCPGPVRDDCVQQIKDIDKALPTVIFVVTDATGARVDPVQITMDGAPVTDRAEGAELTVDPGEHTFELRAEGHPAASKKLTFHQGEKGRKEAVVLEGPPQPAPAPPPPSRPQPAAPAETAVATTPPAAPVAPPATVERGGNGRRTLAYVVGSVGLVGLGVGTYFGLKAKSTYDDAVARCPNGPSTCDTTGADGGTDAHNQATVSTIAFAAGGALVTAGLVLYFTAPRSGNVSVQPTAGLGTAGLRLGGTW
jgi:hypothetical protein